MTVDFLSSLTHVYTTGIFSILFYYQGDIGIIFMIDKFVAREASQDFHVCRFYFQCMERISSPIMTNIY